MHTASTDLYDSTREGTAPAGRVAGKIVVITGAARGPGAAQAHVTDHAAWVRLATNHGAKIAVDGGFTGQAGVKAFFDAVRAVGRSDGGTATSAASLTDAATQ
jgi:hypothetical protein